MSALGMICLAAGASADQISEGTINAYFTNYSVLDDHPRCNGFGETAYEVLFEANDVRFGVVHQPTGESVQSKTLRVQIRDGEPILEERPRCYRTERRGTEVMQLEISCSGERTSEDPFSRLALQNTSLSFSARVEVCFSFARFELLDGAWDAQFQTGLQNSQHQGTFLTRPEAICDQPVPAQLPFATLDYALSGAWAHPGDYEQWWRVRDYSEASAPSVFRLVLRGLPLPSDEDISSPFAVDAAAFFFLTDEDGSNCPGGVCELPKRVPRAVGNETTVCP